VLSDPPLADGAERRVLVGDATAELPRLVSDARELIGNLTRLPPRFRAGCQPGQRARPSPSAAPARASCAGRGRREADRRLQRVNTLLARIDAMAAKADAQVLGPQGLVNESKAGVAQLNALLGDARQTLRRSTRCSPRRRAWRATRARRHRSRRAARRGRRHGAQGRATGRRGQPQVALQRDTELKLK
jgi:hypothetical protein